MSRAAIIEQYQTSANLLLELSANTGISVNLVITFFANYFSEISGYANTHCISFTEAAKHFEESGKQEDFIKEFRNIAKEKVVQ